MSVPKQLVTDWAEKAGVLNAGQDSSQLLKGCHFFVLFNRARIISATPQKKVWEKKTTTKPNHKKQNKKPGSYLDLKLLDLETVVQPLHTKYVLRNKKKQALS